MHPSDFGVGYLNLAKTFDTLLAATRGLSPSAGPPHVVHPFFSPLFPPMPPPPPPPHGAYSLHNPLLLPLMQPAPPAGFPVLGFPSPPLPQHSRFSFTPAANASLVIRADDDEDREAINHA